MRRARPRLAMYWASACGGCEVAVLNLGDKILMLDRFFEIVFFPCIADFKKSDVHAFADGFIDLCLFNGAIRSSEDREMARLLRRKSKILVAFGSCAHEGCIPSLINLSTTAECFSTVYLDNLTTANPEGRLPLFRTSVPEGELLLPSLADTVQTLDQVERVDYVIPGCPPEPPQLWSALEVFVHSLTGGAVLPPAGTVLGGARVALCEECPLERTEQPVRAFVRPHHVVPDPAVCLLDQGVVCLGVATRGGCGALCPQVGMGCRGCYGAVNEGSDFGAMAISALAATTDSGGVHDDEATLRSRIEHTMSTLVDPVGTLYRFSLAGSLLRGSRPNQPVLPRQDHEEDQH